METLDTASLATQVQTYNKVLTTMEDGGKILLANQARISKILASGNQILEMVRAAGGEITPKIDATCQEYLVNVRKAIEQIKATRAPVTQMAQEITRIFTALENSITVTVDQIQSIRNAYASQVKAAEEKRRLEAERKAARAREEVDLQARIETALVSHYQSYLSWSKTKLNEAFSKITLENIREKEAGITALEGVYPKDYHDRFAYVSAPALHSAAEVVAMASRIMEERYPEFCTAFSKGIAEHRQYMLDRIPAKRQELLEVQYANRVAYLLENQMARHDDQQGICFKFETVTIREEIIRNPDPDVWTKALGSLLPALEAATRREMKRLSEESRAAKTKAEKKALEDKLAREKKDAEDAQLAAEAEKTRLAAEKAAREKAETDRIAAEAEEARSKEQLRIDSNKAAAETLVLFTQEADMAVLDEGPSRKDGAQIKILHHAGYVQIFQFWWERVGKNQDSEKIENTKIAQMISFAERVATKGGDRIVSHFVKYEEVTKAINKRKKEEAL